MGANGQETNPGYFRGPLLGHFAATEQADGDQSQGDSHEVAQAIAAHDRSSRLRAWLFDYSDGRRVSHHGRSLGGQARQTSNAHVDRPRRANASERIGAYVDPANTGDAKTRAFRGVAGRRERAPGRTESPALSYPQDGARRRGAASA